MKEQYSYSLREDQVDLIHFMDLDDNELAYCTYKNVDGKFQFYADKEPMFSPAGNPVLVKNPLLELIVIDFNRWGTGYFQYPFTCICYFFSYLDFIKSHSEEYLRNRILELLKEDWMLQGGVDVNLQMLQYVEWHPEQNPFMPQYKFWLSGLSKSQLGGVLLLHEVYESVYLPYILTKGLRYKSQTKILKLFKNAYWRRKKLDYPRKYWKYANIHWNFQTFRFWMEHYGEME